MLITSFLYFFAVAIHLQFRVFNSVKGNMLSFELIFERKRTPLTLGTHSHAVTTIALQATVLPSLKSLSSLHSCVHVVGKIYSIKHAD